MATIQGGSVVWNLDVDSAKFDDEIRSAGDQVDALGSKMATADSGGRVFSTHLQSAFSSVADGLGRILVGASALAVGGSFGLTAMATAAFDQVEQVQNATFALRAYTSSAGQANTVLAQLVAYARSPLGTLFQRQDLFAAAQTLLGFGDAADTVAKHVEILSKGVALGYTNFNDLSLIIGRVAQSGFLDAVSFDELATRGIVLSGSLRSTKITADQLYAALNKALPDKLLEGRAQTIQGRMIQLQSAFRDLGSAILGVDAKTSSFIAGGLGDTLVNALSQIRLELKDPALITTFKTMGQQIADFAVNAIPQLIKGFTFIVENIPNIVAGFAALVAAFAATKAAAIGLSISMAFADGLLTWPIVAIVAGVVAISAALTFLQVRFNILGQAIGAVQAIIDPFARIFENRFQRMIQLANGFGVSFQFGGAQNTVDNFITFLDNRLTRASQIAGLWVQNVFNRLAGRTAGQDPATFYDALIGVMNRFDYAVKKAFDDIKPALAQLTASFALTAQIVKTQIVPAFDALVAVTKPLIAALAPLVKDTFKVAFIALAGAIGIATVALISFTSGVITGIAHALPYVAQALEGIIQTIRGFVQIVDGLMTGNLPLAFEGAKQSGKGLFDFFSNIFTALGKFFSGFVPGFVAPFKADVKAALAEAFTFIEGKFDSLKNHVQAVFDAINKVYSEHKTTINIVVGVITAFFLPAIIAVATQAAISGAILAAQFIAQIVRTGIEAVITGSILTVQFIGAMITMAAQAVVTGAIMTAQFIAMIVRTGIEAAVTATVGLAQLIGATIMWGIEGWKTVAMVIVRGAEMAISTGLMVADTLATWAAAAATGAMTAATWLLDAALAVLTWPITLVVLAIVALIAIGYLLITHWGAVSAAAQATWNAVSTWFNAIKNSVVNAITGAWAAVTSEVSKWPGQFYDWGSNVAKAFADGFGQLGNWLKQKITDGLNAAKAFLKGQSPPPDGPFKDIDKWGFNVGKAWADGLGLAVSQLTLPDMQSTFALQDPLASSYGQQYAQATTPTASQQGNGGNAVSVHVDNLNVQKASDATDIARDLAFRVQTAPGYVKNG